MRNNRLGCLSGTGLLAALITALVIAGYAYARGSMMYSPGPLSTQGARSLGGVTSHAETGGDCQACHTAPWEAATMADRCTVCHSDIAAQMRNVATMHGTLLHDDPRLGCRHCHPEHRGATAQLTVMEDASFPHEVVGFSLKGHQLTAARKPFICKDCHQGDIRTFALDSCDNCHRQIDSAFMTAHTLSFGSACLDCHDGVDRFGKNFDHNVFSFKITGKHVGLACVQCHINARGSGDFQAAL
ncbi:MAG TPA: cytochrome c3 family protein, partial [Anaerolineales bacterium]|nr:cytochrome c3 family protein [Anaerolineales bacterium]